MGLHHDQAKYAALRAVERLTRERVWTTVEWELACQIYLQLIGGIE